MNKCGTIDESEEQLTPIVIIWYSSVHIMLHDRLHFRMVCAARVSQNLTEEQKAQMCASVNGIWTATDSRITVVSIVTGDETACH